MQSDELIMLIFTVAGGLALFIFGMSVMTDGLKKSAGNNLRRLLSITTRNKISGIGLGTILGFLVHSGATTVMLVSFVNAGLMNLYQSIPPVLGANIGTTLSMQLISFRLDDYSFIPIALGLLLKLVFPNQRVRNIGNALFGFGLIFLGMKTMSDAIKPHKEILSTFLSGINSQRFSSLLLGIILAAIFTAVLQSSGATIGICFAMISAGVFRDISHVYPIILGSHIGTCTPTLLSSIGTNIESKRTAFSHLFFNIFNVIIGIIAAPLFTSIIALSAGNLIHQTANLHTFVMLTGALLILPISKLYADFVSTVIGYKRQPPQPSYLEQELINKPEQAIYAAIRELKRVTGICYQSMRENAKLFFGNKQETIQIIRLNEKIVDEIKLAMKQYLTTLTGKFLSRRQSVLIQDIRRCMAEIERIGDHIDELCDLSVSRNMNMPKALFDEESFEQLFQLYDSALNVLRVLVKSLEPENIDFDNVAKDILEARDKFARLSASIRELCTAKLLNREMSPIAGMYYTEYIAALDRLVRHSKIIAIAETRPEFLIKKRKLERVADDTPEFEIPKLVNPDDYLKRIEAVEDP